MPRWPRSGANSPHDVPVLVQLAQFYDRLGREEAAMTLCERIMKLDPSWTGAAVNLGIYRMKRGQAAEAIALWEGDLRRNPGLSDLRAAK